jgi:hypothetical protein
MACDEVCGRGPECGAEYWGFCMVSASPTGGLMALIEDGKRKCLEGRVTDCYFGIIQLNSSKALAREVLLSV